MCASDTVGRLKKLSQNCSLMFFFEELILSTDYIGTVLSPRSIMGWLRSYKIIITVLLIIFIHTALSCVR